MKKFDEWFDSHRSYRGPHTCQTSRGENLAHLHDEEVWKAALEWALSHDTGPCSFNKCNIRDIIEKELESE